MCRLWTSIQSLHQPKRLGLVGYPDRVSADSAAAPWVLVYGGATSTGLYAIQILHLAGYRVVTTASPKNFSLLRSLGADAVVDYRDPDVVGKVKAATNDSIAVGLDAWSAPDSQAASVRCIRPEGGKLIIILLIDQEVAKIRPEVELQRGCSVRVYDPNNDAWHRPIDLHVYRQGVHVCCERQTLP
jgi:NADPH:quinone reductase-like Zn-dependent oxidoreductase